MFPTCGSIADKKAPFGEPFFSHRSGSILITPRSHLAKKGPSLIMETPTSRMASDRLIAAGVFHVSALGHTPELAPLIGVIQPTIDDVEAAAAARATADRNLIPLRVALLFQERDVERALRVLSSSAIALDGKRGGPAHTALFPDGQAIETRPKGQRQVDAADRVLNRLASASPAEPLRAAHTSTLTTARNALQAGIDARKAATAVLGAAIAAELSAREDFVRAYDGNAGAIRQHFPKDRESQELYFDSLGGTRSTTSDDEEDAEAVT